MTRFTRLLIPTDFSPASDIALEYGLDLATRFGARVEVLHVIDDFSVLAAYPDGFYAELPGLRDQLRTEAEDRLRTLEARYQTAGVPFATEIVIGRPARAIVREATDRGVDLIVMGTHGRSGFEHLVLGSVAERVLRTAPCPVLTVRDTSRVADEIAAEVARRHPAPPEPDMTDAHPA